ncbi:MAG TPA: hypothetical protein V6C65_04235 [Allocoleopsis sp.]
MNPSIWLTGDVVICEGIEAIVATLVDGTAILQTATNSFLVAPQSTLELAGWHLTPLKVAA